MPIAIAAVQAPQIGLLRIATVDGRVEDEGWRVRKDRTRFRANVVITALRNADGVLTGFGKITRDLTERKTHEGQLEFLADHDPLTGVQNRRGFLRELDAYVATADRYGARGALFMVDLDHFKNFNDTFGHVAGDNLVVEIARGLEERIRKSDVIARLGGDEFAVFLPEADESTAKLLAEALLGVVRERALDVRECLGKPVTASIGVALFADAKKLSATETLINADLAMYDAKARGRDRRTRFRRELGER